MPPINEVDLFRRIAYRAKKELVPKLRIGPKKSFWIHKVINAFLNVIYTGASNDQYQKRYSTTIGYTVALADKYGNDPQSFKCWELLCHEIQHAVRARKLTRVLFGFLYLWPISQGVLLLLLCWLPIFWAEGWSLVAWISGWVCVAGLHFIPQVPDPFRKKEELEAYTVSMHLYHMRRNVIEYVYLQRIARQFHSMAYYMMEPRKKKILQELTTRFARIQQGKSPVAELPIVKIAEEEYQKCLDVSKRSWD